MIFGSIGGAVFLMGLAMQFELTGRWHVPPVISYMIQAVVSVEASFVLNRWLTWRDRATPLWTALWRFNIQKAVTITINLALYAGLLRLGVNYLLANIVLTAAFTVVNYVVGDSFVFVPGTPGRDSQICGTSGAGLDAESFTATGQRGYSVRSKRSDYRGGGPVPARSGLSASS
jgi:putative flippase GtrA